MAGLVVNERLAIARCELKRLEAVLTNCVRHGPDGQNRRDHPDFRSHLDGKVAWVTQVDPRRGARLGELLAQIRW